MKIQLKFFKNLSIYKLIILFIVVIITLILFFLTLNKSLGGTLNYIVFSSLSIILLIIGLIQKQSVGYMVFSIFIYLGFFLKHSFHLIFEYDYLEPIGKFDNSYSQWNEFYEISSIGFFSFVILGIYLIFSNKILLTKNFQANKIFISFKNLNLLWIILILFVIILLILNEIFQFQKLGIEKEKIFNFWFLEISIIMLISIVLPIFMFIVSFYEINQRNNYYKTVFFIMAVSALFSISILSRSVVVFWCMPLLFLPLFKRINFKQYLYILILYLFFIFFTVGVSTLLRTASINTFNRLLIDRWIGVEGLMVVIGMQNKNFNNLFYERKNGEVDFFTKDALNENIKDLEKTSYATLPGIIGFLYLSGSEIFLFTGCFLFLLYIISIEKVVLFFTNNFLLSSFLAISLSGGISGFGIDLISWIKVQIFTILVISLIYFIFIKFLKGKKI